MITNIQEYLNRTAIYAVLDVVDEFILTDQDDDVDNDIIGDLKTDLSMIMGDNTIVSGGKHSDYRFNLLIPVFRKIQATIGGRLTPKLNPNTLAELIRQKMEIFDAAYQNVIGQTCIAKVYVNIDLSTSYLLRNSLQMAEMVGKRELLAGFMNTDSTERIVMDYSSPNVAKEMHVGHLRSTIIGDSLYRLLCLFIPKEQILCLNHIGDWGTQFGMIINYMRYVYADFAEIMRFLEGAESADLLKVYRSAKICFDNKENEDEFLTFADDSRYQTFCLQQGDRSDDVSVHRIHDENHMIWRRICFISSIAYSDVYRRLNISEDLIERGESFYNPFIPDVIEMLRERGLAQEKDGALMIHLDEWEFPLIIKKSDGGYTYATTDLTAVWHRVYVENATKIIYITDKGQAPHFDKVFEIAEAMGWTQSAGRNTDRGTELMHIGFGLVSGLDGKKLKTRSGDTVKLVDVIDEVTGISKRVIEERAARANAGEDVHDGYAQIDDAQIVDMSDKIGINTLKYYDLSFLYQSNYKYDPDKMFEFQGDTGVYQMYCFCRILSIINKSTFEMADTTANALELLHALDSSTGEITAIPEFADLTPIDRDLMFILSEFHATIQMAKESTNIKPVMDYIKILTSQFSRFVSKHNKKIVGGETEKFRATLCAVCYRVLDHIFEILGFGKIDFI
jgi:arginyl-tRNA synthetase